MSVKKIILAVVVLTVVVLQFFVKKDNVSSYESVASFEKSFNVPEEVKTIFRASCYDCHSNHTKYPWYASIGAVNLLLDHHIEEGKEHLNFSEWSTYPEARQLHKLAEVYEEVEEDEMPLKVYRLTHGDLSEKEKETLILWAAQFKEH
ncbi:heme-binding domain-containing protein [Aquimarina agarilytica]|uniref:heme-binding domain-containing protein n=1 Tax=Aquimarina agarilytica TaxID=1087449 RepID=UPI0002895147|nr:heme-binding domain-containing protein [Aquimarina agarilytica]